MDKALLLLFITITVTSYAALSRWFVQQTYSSLARLFSGLAAAAAGGADNREGSDDRSRGRDGKAGAGPATGSNQNMVLMATVTTAWLSILYVILAFALDDLLFPLCFVALQLFGSICAGPVIANFAGIGQDLQQQGSGNTGATNMVRVAGWRLGLLTLSLDAGKGAVLAVLLKTGLIKLLDRLGSGVVGGEIVSGLNSDNLLQAVVLITATLFHIWPIWPNIRGGKGVAVLIGASAMLLPWYIFGAAAAVWFIIFFTTRWVSLASLLACSIPSLFWLLHLGFQVIAGGCNSDDGDGVCTADCGVKLVVGDGSSSGLGGVAAISGSSVSRGSSDRTEVGESRVLQGMRQRLQNLQSLQQPLFCSALLFFALPGLIAYCHRSNIGRLRRRDEKRFMAKK